MNFASQEKQMAKSLAAEGRISQVTEKVRQIDQAISTLQDSIQLLENRLDPVMMPPMPTGTVEDAKKPMLVPLADALNMSAMQIRMAAERISSIVQRIEL